MAIPQKMNKNRTIIQFRNPSSGYITKGTKINIIERYLYPVSQKYEINLSVYQWINGNEENIHIYTHIHTMKYCKAIKKMILL